jgi:hypothetical protein
MLNSNFRLFAARENGNANFYLFAENRNVKRKLFFHSRQMVNGNRPLLFQQTCPSIAKWQLEEMTSDSLKMEDNG